MTSPWQNSNHFLNQPYGNIVKRHDQKKLFDMLLPHVGIWSRMPMQQQKPLVAHILSTPITPIIKNMSFILNREACYHSEKFSWSYKLMRTLYSKISTKDVCKQDHVLFVDVKSLLLTLHLDYICYICWPLMCKLSRPTWSNILSNVATNILVRFIYPLHKFESIPE